MAGAILFFACKRIPQGFAVIAAKWMEFIFGRGVYVDENTSRPANVRVGRCWRTTSALQQGAKPFVKKAAAFLTA
jgi:hypothetical protein